MSDKNSKKDSSELEKKLLQEWPDLDQKDLGAVLGSRDRLIQKLVREQGLIYEDAHKRLNEIDK